jgi:hypothetical protein
MVAKKRKVAKKPDVLREIAVHLGGHGGVLQTISAYLGPQFLLAFGRDPTERGAVCLTTGRLSKLSAGGRYLTHTRSWSCDGERGGKTTVFSVRLKGLLRHGVRYGRSAKKAGMLKSVTLRMGGVTSMYKVEPADPMWGSLQILRGTGPFGDFRLQVAHPIARVPMAREWYSGCGTCCGTCCGT